MSLRLRVDRGGEDRDHTNWNIVEVLRHLGYDGPGATSGGWTEVRCPFHRDRNKSAGVHLGKNAFKCHACEAKGNSVTLTMQQLSVSEQDAVEWLEAQVDGTGYSSSGQQGSGRSQQGASQRSLYTLPDRFRGHWKR